MDLLKLAERCEQAVKPDQGIDRDIALIALRWTVEVDTTIFKSGEPVDYWTCPNGYIQGYYPPSFTSSLDAAKTLWPGEVLHLIPSNPRIASAMALRARAAKVEAGR